MIKKILKKIVAHDYKFIMANQNPDVYTRKMLRIARRYDILRTKYDKMCYNAEKRLTISKFIRLLRKQNQMAPDTIIGTHPNKHWKKQGMKHAYEYKNTGINRVLNNKNFF